ncbi:hypothetical protein [Kitasatospora sp. NPDC088548]|uniref:hypothetical protein n=1 Tax=Kitasatospora sp. NPDC088548 TaxID=3364075 RepID=UPI0037F12BF9
MIVLSSLKGYVGRSCRIATPGAPDPPAPDAVLAHTTAERPRPTAPTSCSRPQITAVRRQHARHRAVGPPRRPGSRDRISRRAHDVTNSPGAPSVYVNGVGNLGGFGDVQRWMAMLIGVTGQVGSTGDWNRDKL